MSDASESESCICHTSPLDYMEKIDSTKEIVNCQSFMLSYIYIHIYIYIYIYIYMIKFKDQEKMQHLHAFVIFHSETIF